MSDQFGGVSVPAELFIITCMLAGVLVLLLCIYLELVVIRLRQPLPRKDLSDGRKARDR